MNPDLLAGLIFVLVVGVLAAVCIYYERRNKAKTKAKELACLDLLQQWADDKIPKQEQSQRLSGMFYRNELPDYIQHYELSKPHVVRHRIKFHSN